jgi:hypothetical protein
VVEGRAGTGRLHGRAIQPAVGAEAWDALAHTEDRLHDDENNNNPPRPETDDEKWVFHIPRVVGVEANYGCHSGHRDAHPPTTDVVVKEEVVLLLGDEDEDHSHTNRTESVALEDRRTTCSEVVAVVLSACDRGDLEYW